jgi:hypothetical protein
MPAPAGDEFDPVETQWSSFPASRACAAREGKPGAETGTGVCGASWVPFPSLRSAGNDKVWFCLNDRDAVEISNHSNSRKTP